MNSAVPASAGAASLMRCFHLDDLADFASMQRKNGSACFAEVDLDGKRLSLYDSPYMRMPLVEESRSRIRLLVMDRRPVYARGLRLVLAQSPELEVVDARDADVILLSGVAPQTGALAALAHARATNAHAATVMLVEDATPSFVTSAHAAGVAGMLLENVEPQALIEAMIAVHRGSKVFDPLLADIHREARISLSDRELDVLRLAGEGASPHAISRMLNISKSTTRTYLSGAIRKMGAQNRGDAVRTARGLGWL